MGIDPEVLSMLKDMEFEKSSLQNCPIFYNHAQATTNIADLCFTKKYRDSHEAQVAETLVDLHLRISEKGTSTFPTKDKLVRGFKSQQTQPVQMYTQRQLNFLTLVIPLKYESLRNLDVQKSIVHEMFSHPLGFSDQRIYDRVVDEEVKEIEDRISDHEHMASRKFKSRFYPSLSPLSDNDEKELLKKCTPAMLRYALHKQMESGTILVSGTMKMDETIQNLRNSFGDYFQKYIPQKKAPPLTLKMEGKTVHEFGPTDQMQFIRAYPLTKKPTSTREQLCLEMANEMLGGTWTSPLMQIIREQHHLVYGIHSTYFPNLQTLSISTSHDPKDFAKIEQLTDMITQNFVKGNIPKEQFEIEKERMLENYVAQNHHQILTCDSPMMRTEYAYKRFIDGTQKQSMADEYKALSTITLGEMKKVLKEYIDPKVSQVFTYSKEGAK